MATKENINSKINEYIPIIDTFLKSKKLYSPNYKILAYETLVEFVYNFYNNNISISIDNFNEMLFKQILGAIQIEIKNYNKIKSNEISLDTTAIRHKDDKKEGLHNFLKSKDKIAIDIILDDEEFKELEHFLSNLKSPADSIFKKFFGINEEEQSISDIAKFYNTDKEKIKLIIKYFLKEIKKQLGETVYNKYVNFIKHKQLVKKSKQSLYLLPSKFQKIIKSYYGIGTKKQTQQEIANELNCSKTYISKIISKSIDFIKNINNYDLDSLPPSFININTLKYYLQLSDDELNFRLSLLDEQYKNIICKYFGIGTKKLTQQEIANEFKCSQTNISQIINSVIHFIKNIDKYYINTLPPSFININTLKYYLQLSNEELNFRLSLLDEVNRTIVCKFFGIGTKKLTQQEIANEFEYSQTKIYSLIAKSLKFIKDVKNFDFKSNQI